MPTSTTDEQTARVAPLSRKSALIVGLGGLGSPSAMILGRAGVGKLYLADDDLVEESNLHRQPLYRDEDIGRDKLEAARDGLVRDGVDVARIELLRARFLPGNAREFCADVDVVLEGADNFATKFLCADACFLEHTPVVHGAAIRWTATVLPVDPLGAPCYRCLFEDLPEGDAQPNCNTAGVMGPVVGFAGALMADHALRILSGAPSYAAINTYDGMADRLRDVALSPRSACPLCGTDRRILDINETRYTKSVYAA